MTSAKRIAAEKPLGNFCRAPKKGRFLGSQFTPKRQLFTLLFLNGLSP
jgi:hypothetical protein